ncbi:MAG: bifunctional demethylmenaquinone methyltransferase/2-methoxy-6-polyprenyl-1,4-benzoquinol methylase UbiE [Planctomycetota bacterium]
MAALVEEQASEQSVDKAGEKVRDMFAQIAPRYDLMNHVLSLGIDISWRKKVLKLLRLDREQPVLDCCTGTGDLALMLAKHGGGKYDVIGTDFCAPMLERAGTKHEKSIPDLPVTFIEADSQNLPFDDNHFQAVTVAFGLRNVEDTDRGIREMVRVCAPGGQVCVLEFSKPTAPGLKQLYQSYFTHVLPRVGQAVAKNNRGAYEYLPNSVASFPCGQALADRMEAAGLESVSVTPLTLGVASIYIGDKPAGS